MTRFEVMYLCFGSFLITAGVIMVTTYTLTNPWWRGHLGRMLVTYAMAEILMSTLLMTAVVWHFSPYWFRTVWFFLQTVVGGTFWFQTVVILRLYFQRRHTEPRT